MKSVCWSQTQSFNVFSLSVEDGLSHNDVRKVFQDSRGYIWFGTYDGLCRYDGNSVTAYFTRLGDTTAISHNTVNDIWEDEEKYLWIATRDGLNRFDPKLESFQRFSLSYDMPDKKPLTIHQILPDQHGNLWLATPSYGLCFYDKKKQKILHFEFLSEPVNVDSYFQEPSISAQCFDISDSSKIWLACPDGLYSFNTKSHTYRRHFQYSKHLTDIIQTGKNQLWMSCWEGGLIGFDMLTNKRTHVADDRYIVSLMRKSDHEIWFSDLSNGIGIFNLKNNDINYVKNEKQVPSSISIQSLSHISRTNDMTWFTEGVATPLFKGIEVFDPSLNNFDLFPLDPHLPFQIEEVFPDQFAFDEINSTTLVSVWLGDGIYYLNNKGQTENIIRYKNRDVLNVTLDKQKNVWASSLNSILKLNPVTQRLQVFIPENLTILLSYILVIYLDKKGILWIGDREGHLLRIEPKSGSTEHFQIPPDHFNRDVSTPSILCMTEDSKGNLWIGTGDGLYIMNQLDNNIELFDNRPNDPSTLIQNQISNMVIDSKDQLWICNQVHGIQVFDTETRKIVKHLTKDTGLPSDRIYNVIVDHNNDLWMLYPNGIARYTPLSEQLLNYELKDGLPLARTDMEIALSPSGHIYFSGYNSFYRFHPDSLFIPPSPPLSFTHFKVFEDDLQLEPVLDYQQSIQLRHDENFISIGFKALNFYQSLNIKYIYQLEGFEDHWVTSSENHSSASYSNLKPGSYTFRVRVINNGSINDDSIRILNIKITPAWWQTILFKLLVALILSGIFYKLYKWRIGEVRKNERIEKKLAELKLEALRSQMNPHFIFNSLTSIYQLIQSKQNKEAALYLTQFSKLIRLVLNMSEQKTVSLERELELARLFLNMEKLRFEDKFEYDISIDSTLDPSNLRLPPMIFQPYLENAIWHGLLHSDKPGKLNISIFPAENGWKCRIEDNGIGRAAASLLKSYDYKENDSKGMNITKLRLQMNTQLQSQMMSVKVIDKNGELKNDFGTIIELYFSNE